MHLYWKTFSFLFSFKKWNHSQGKRENKAHIHNTQKQKQKQKQKKPVEEEAVTREKNIMCKTICGLTFRTSWFRGNSLCSIPFQTNANRKKRELHEWSWLWNMKVVNIIVIIFVGAIFIFLFIIIMLRDSTELLGCYRWWWSCSVNARFSSSYYIWDKTWKKKQNKVKE